MPTYKVWVREYDCNKDVRKSHKSAPTGHKRIGPLYAKESEAKTNASIWKDQCKARKEAKKDEYQIWVKESSCNKDVRREDKSGPSGYTRYRGFYKYESDAKNRADVWKKDCKEKKDLEKNYRSLYIRDSDCSYYTDKVGSVPKTGFRQKSQKVRISHVKQEADAWLQACINGKTPQNPIQSETPRPVGGGGSLLLMLLMGGLLVFLV